MIDDDKEVNEFYQELSDSRYSIARRARCHINYLNEKIEQKDQFLDCFLAVIQYALKDEDGLLFLRYWNEGDFQAIRKEWPDAPEEVFIGADTLHPKTKR